MFKHLCKILSHRFNPYGANSAYVCPSAKTASQVTSVLLSWSKAMLLKVFPPSLHYTFYLQPSTEIIVTFQVTIKLFIY